MNIEDKIKIMTAYTQGDDIEVMIAGKDIWDNVDVPTWNWRDNDYRIKVGVELALYSCFVVDEAYYISPRPYAGVLEFMLEYSGANYINHHILPNSKYTL